MSFPEDKVYSVVISGKDCGFFLEHKEDGRIFLVIPDCGGMADMLPRVPEQLTWLEPRMERIRGANRIWYTIWDLTTPDAVMAVEQLFLREGKLSEKQRVDFY